MNKKNIIIVLIILALLYFIYVKFFNKEKKILNNAYNNLQFEFGKSIIKEESKPSLNDLAEYLNSNNFTLTLIGHTDNIGTNNDNLILSKKRADAVKTYLINKGISEFRINTIGKGEAEPIASNDNEEGRAKNRRVEFIIEKLLM